MTISNSQNLALIEDLYKLYEKSTGVCIDTRKIEKGNLYFALKGENFDGNNFAKRALEQGAIGVIVDDLEVYERIEKDCLFVSDSLKALQDLAMYHRDTLSIPIIAITGSNGKTTTKELLYEVLATENIVYATKGNFNNHIGVPLTLLAIGNEIEIGIVEMGANHLEEISFLCQLAKPTHGVITNIGKAHLEGFGSFENIKRGKSELYRYLAKNNGLAFIQPHDIVLNELLEPDQQTIKLINRSEFNVIQSFPKLVVEYSSMNIETQITGEYNIGNVLIAFGIGDYFKVELNNCVSAIKNYSPSNNRSQILIEDEITFILDSYNANPSSMRKSIENVAHGDISETALVLGDMKELGAYQKKEHQELLKFVASLNWGEVYTVGKVFYSLQDNDFKAFEDVMKLKEHLIKNPFTVKTVLLKGSRSIALEKLIE